MASVKPLRSTFLCLAATAFSLSLQFALIDAHGGDTSDHHGSEDDLSSKSLTLVKIGCLLVLFFSTFIFGISPYFFSWNDSFLLLGTQFAAGIFLGTSLMHFLPDSNSTFESLTSREYPFAYMLACAGYLLTMFGDCVISTITKRSKGETEVRAEEEKRIDVEGQGEGHHNPYLLRTTSVGDTVLLILALCFHSVFEGIAVGVAGNKADAWRNLWTISLHKVFAAVAMGIALLKMLPRRPFLAIVGYSFAFAISSPVGVGIGIGIDSTTEGRIADWIFAVSMGFACGIFFYVSINHLIAKGYKPRSPCNFDTPLFKFLAVFAGVAVMAIVMTWD